MIRLSSRPLLAALAIALPFATNCSAQPALVTPPRINAFSKVPQAVSPDSVLILANSNESQSVELARYYARKRGIPLDNIVALPMSAKETVAWDEFVGSIWNPLHAWMLENKWINEGLAEKDVQGREHGLMIGHRVGWLVICQGVPLRISENPALHTPELGEQFMLALGAKPGTKADAVSPLLKHSFASVDSELAAMPARNNPVYGFVPNPLFRRENPGPMELSGIIRTARLGGTSYLAAQRLVDSAIEGEKRGLDGRVYIDKGGPFPQAEQWLDRIAASYSAAGWDVELDEAKATFRADSRFDAPALYFGWYVQFVDGPFVEPGMHFPAGAIAMHLHSFSASSLADEKRWSAALVDRGAAGTIGNVFEPTLTLTHDFDVIAQAILAGWSFGDAAWCSMPALSWQGIILGDPLYRPLAPREKTDENSPRMGTLDQYADIRAIMRLEKDGRVDEALALAQSCYSKRPGYAIALKLAQMQHALGNDGGAEMTLGFMARMRGMDCDQRNLALQSARLLSGFGSKTADALAMEILGKLREMDTGKDFAEAVRAAGYDIVKRSGSAAELLEWSKAAAR